MKNGNESAPLLDFVTAIRRVLLVVLVAWLILTVARYIKLEPSRDPFTPPNPPFQAVTSQSISSSGASSHKETIGAMPGGSWLTTADSFVQGIFQVILYSHR